MGYHHGKPYEKSKWYLPNWSWTETLFCFGERFRSDVLCISNCWLHYNIGNEKWTRIVQKNECDVDVDDDIKQASKQISELVSVEDTCICSVRYTIYNCSCHKFRFLHSSNAFNAVNSFSSCFRIFSFVFFCYCRALFPLHWMLLFFPQYSTFIVVPSWFEIQSYNRDIVSECLALTMLIQLFGERKIFFLLFRLLLLLVVLVVTTMMMMPLFFKKYCSYGCSARLLWYFGVHFVQ